MVYNKKTWKARLGQGLNKFSIDGATPVPIINQPDSVTEQGDALSAGNLNDLEDRIDNAFEEIADGTQVVGKATADASGNVIDQTYETKADASDLKDACSALDKRVTNLELKIGDLLPVDYPSSTYGMDGVPSNVEPYAKVKVLKGVGRIANHLVKNGTFDSTDNWNVSSSGATWSVSGNVATISYDTAYRGINQPISFLKGHKYLVRVDLKKVDADAGVQVAISDNSNFTLSVSTDNVGTNWTSCEAIVSTDTNVGSSVAIFIRNGSSGYASAKSVQARNVVLTDLTVYFNGSIPSNAQTIDGIRQNYPELLEPSDYDAGSIVDTTYSAVKSQGVNLWDEKWIVGGLNNNTGLPDASRTNRISSEDFIPISQYKLYYYLNTADVAWLYFYDKDKNYIGRKDSNSASFTPLAGSSFMKFETWNGYGNVYKNDVQISEVINNTTTSVNTTYHPYMTDTLTLPTPVTLRSAGSVAEEFDLESGEKTNVIGSVNLGTLTWVKISQTFFSTQVTTKKIGSPVVCDRYAYGGIKGDAEMASAATGIYVGYTTQEIKIKDDSLIGMTTGEFRAAMSGVILLYELATPDAPTQLTPITDPFIQVEGGGTIKPLQSQTPKIDSAMTVEYMAS